MFGEIKIEFTDKEITPHAGIILMLEMLRKIDFDDILSSLCLPQQMSNRGYDPKQLILFFIIGIWCGASRLEHLEVTRMDGTLQDILHWDRMPGNRSLKRYFDKFDQSTNQMVFERLYQRFFEWITFDNITLDVDSTVLTRYGEQEGSAKGYNPRKPGRASHHPLLAFIPDIRMIGNFWLRPGNARSANNFLNFLKDTMRKLSPRKVGLIRGDSGFFEKEILDYLENPGEGQSPYNYIISAKFNPPIQRAIAYRYNWITIAPGIEYSETDYQADSWKKPRRFVIVRQLIKERPKAAGRQLRLFQDDIFYNKYRYSCFVTNLTLPARSVYDLYRGRADAENRIKELKYDFGMDKFNNKDFWSTEAMLNFVVLAYNLMSLFRQNILRTKQMPFLRTIHYQVFDIAGYMIKQGNKRILKLARDMKRRRWFKGLWSQCQDSLWPFVPPPLHDP